MSKPLTAGDRAERGREWIISSRTLVISASRRCPRPPSMPVIRCSVPPAALHTAGHALVLGDDGSPAGLLTPADMARAQQVGALYADLRTR
jgi:hypothetical protein